MKGFLATLTLLALVVVSTGCNRTVNIATASDTSASHPAKPKPSIPTIPLLDRETPAMQDAIRTARREIDTFLDRLQHPQPNQTDFAIKAAFAEGEQIEHMWLIDLKYDSGLLIGTLANQPELTKTFEYGTSYAVTPEEISDWYYFENDRMIGGYTLQ